MGIFDIFKKKKVQNDEIVLEKEREKKILIKENQEKYRELGYQILYKEIDTAKDINEASKMFWETFLTDEVMWGGNIEETFDTLDEYGFKTDKAKGYMMMLFKDCKSLFPATIKGNPFFEIIHNFNKNKSSNECKILRDNMSTVWNAIICISGGDEERFADYSNELRGTLLSISPEEWGYGSREFALVLKDKFADYLDNPELREQLLKSGLYLYELK